MKKGSGGRIWPSRKKRKYELGREPVDTEIGPKKKVEISVRGNDKKSKLLSVDSINVTDPETGESAKGKVSSVLENPADPNLARRNILTKGAIIETDVGKVRVKSRPGQEETLNGILLEGDLEKKAEEKVEEKEVKEEKEAEKATEEVSEKEAEPEEKVEEAGGRRSSRRNRRKESRRTGKIEGN